MREILSQLPADFPAPILYLQHLSPADRSALAEVLSACTALEIRWAQEGDRLRAGVVYLCPAGWSFVIRDGGTVGLAPMETRRDRLRAADHFFASVAASYAHRAAAVVLSGAGWDGSEGVCALHSRLGTVLVQDEASSIIWGMPEAALATGCVDVVLPLQDIAPLLVNFVRDRQPLAALRARAAAAGGPRLSVSPALYDALRNLLAMALTEQSTDLGNLQLVDPQLDALAILTQRGFGLDFLTDFRTVGRDDESACARAMSGHAPVLIPDVTTDSRFAAHRDIARSAGFRAVQSTPLIRRGAVVGMLSMHFRTPRWLTQTELRSIEEHARYAAQVIEELRGP